jgi:4-hydroxybenzoyl-CoA reductase subunit beta
MRSLCDFELLRPASAAEAAALLAEGGALALAGGTDLLPNLRRGLHRPQRLVDLGALPGFGRIDAGDGGWRLGAGVTLATLERHAALAAALPALVQAAGAVAGPGHRSAATLGGNLCQDTRCVFYNQSAWWRQTNAFCLKRDGSTCHVAPQGMRCHAVYAGDLAPALIAYGAEAEVTGPQGLRRLPLAELYRDDGAAHLTLARGELLGAVWVPKPPPGAVSAYRKLRSRAAMDFALAGVAMALRLEQGRLATLCIGLSGTNSQPLQLQGSEALLGRTVDEALGLALGKLVAKQVSPMRSTATAAHHRRLLAVNAAQRLLRELALQAPA